LVPFDILIIIYYFLTLNRDNFLELPEIYELEELRPDMQYLEDALPIVLMEAKRPLVEGYLELKDARKLMCMMKLSLDMMIDKNIRSPVVVGLLAQSTRVSMVSILFKADLSILIYLSNIFAAFRRRDRGLHDGASI
jgi:hypothetical protein